MTNLSDQVKSFLEAEGYTVSSRRELFIGSRRTIAEETEYTYVWVPANYDRMTFTSREPTFLSRFEEAARSSPVASRFMVIPTLEGLSRQFVEGVLQWYRVNIRTPLQFFDTDFKWDVSREAPSAAKDLREKGQKESKRRVEQPYTIDNTKESGGDLLETLRIVTKTHGAQGRSVHIVVGPAGIGKSYLFDVLFSELHEDFIKHKTRGGPYAPRPFPLLPDHIPLADARTVRSILAAYLQTDFARPLSRETFEWLLVNEYAVWIIDGLDEAISQDPLFFDYLLHLLRLPNAPAKPKILISLRDALLTSHEPLREFIEGYEKQVALYRLARWEMPSKERFANIALKHSAAEFIDILRSRPSLNELASTPYYCDLLTQQFADGQLREDCSEESLLEHALDSLINRDYDKEFIDKALVETKEVIAFLEAAASQDFERGFQGVSVNDAKDWARILLPSKIEENEQERLSSQMVNLALFSRGSPGYIRFSQEILEHYLLGRRFISLLDDRNRNDALIRELAQRELPSDSVTVRLLAEHVRHTNQFGHLVTLTCNAVAYPTAFKNLLKIAALCPEHSAALRGIPYDRHDLSGLLFDGLDLHGVSFSGCNLTDTEFRRCNLQGAILTDAILRNTGLLSLPTNGLEGAEVGDLTRFFSIRVGRGQTIEDHSKVRKWFQLRTKEKPPMVEPCSSSLQLRCLFNKLVYPDGTVRRTWLTRRAMLSGKRIHSSTTDILDTAIKHRYLLEEERYRDRIHRPEGPLYSELVGFATSLTTTPGIKALLDDVCDKEDCPHVPTVK